VAAEREPSAPFLLWNSPEAVERWQQGAARRAQALGPATERMLDAAGLGPGLRVLDLAAGTGDQTLLAAQRVGPRGAVLAVDISPSMLQIAAASAAEAGLGNVETLAADGSQLDLPPAGFDAAISRLGLMFMPDLQRTLGAVRHALKPGARLAALVWANPASNPSMSTLMDVVREMRGRFTSDDPALVRAFSLGGPGTLARELTAAGFGEVNVEPVAVPRAFASINEAMEVLVNGSNAVADLLGDAPTDVRDQILAEVAVRYRRYVRADGTCLMPGEVLLGVGTN
jgi:ubiquinone/menaquinone biosynthesis C-methylase UbiE